MKDRCSNPNTEAFKDYGKRGVKVCDEWSSDFEKFYDWSMKNGYENGLTIYPNKRIIWTNETIRNI